MVIKYNIKFSDLFFDLVPCIIYIVLGSCGGGLVVYLTNDSPNTFVFIPIIFTVFLFLSPLIFCCIYNLIKKGVLGEHTIEITHDYIRDVTIYSDDKYDWSKIKKVCKSKRGLVILISWTRAYHMILKNFSNTEEYDKFCDLAISYYKQAKKSR